MQYIENIEDIDIMSLVSHLDFTVNEESIQMDLVLLPSQVFEAGAIMAQVRSWLDNCKRRLDLIEAAADSDVRNNPQKHSIVKLTEGAVEAAVTATVEVRELREKVVKAKHANDVAYAAVNALETKRKTLESLVQLKSIGFYAARNVA